MYALMMMAGGLTTLWLVAAWLACAAFCGHLAEEKRYCWPCWLILGVLFGPLALIAAAGLPDKHVMRVTAIAIPDEDSPDYKALGFRQKSSRYELGILIVIVAAVVVFAVLR